MSKPVCAILGVGPGNGLAMAKAFDGAGYALALCARSGDRVREYAGGYEDAKGYACDVTSGEDIARVFGEIAEVQGAVETVIYNAGGGAWGTVDDLAPEDLSANLEINAVGLMRVAQAVLPVYRAQGKGNIIVVSAGAAHRGRPGTLAFAAGKAAQMSVAQSLARQLGAENIHVATIVIDGVIDIPRTRSRMPDKGDKFFLKPAAIADAALMLTRQDRSAWSFEVDVRPFGESW